jgi:rare lipoprotein A
VRRPDQRARAMMALGVLTTTAAAAALHAAPALAAAPTPQPASAITFKLADRTIDYGDAVVARGHVPGAGSGVAVVLEQRLRGAAWAPVARGVTAAGGAYRITAHLPRSGVLRVALAQAAAAATADSTPSPVAQTSRERGVRVAVHVTVTRMHTAVNAGSTARVAGRVRPAVAGRLVVLQRRAHGGWKTLARARTRSGGRYRLAYRVPSAGSAALRVRAAGTPALAGGRHAAGRLNAFRPALASWYGGGQALACGGALTPGMMGVANKSLPCGTMVTIRYRGRQVRVPVVDRGPYAGNREFDLGPGVRSALGFDGVGTIWVSY